MRVSNKLSLVLSRGRLTWSGSPTLDRSTSQIHSSHKLSLNHDEEDGFRDDFDDFEEGAQFAEDDDFGDFGDFDDGFRGPPAAEDVPEPPPLLTDVHQPTFVSRQCSNDNH